MIKKAYQYGLKLAYDEMGLTPDQLSASKNLYGMGGGALGAGVGGGIGAMLGSRAADAFDLDPAVSKAVGGGLGALLGGGLGGYAGTQYAKYRNRGQQPEAPVAAPQDALMATPSYDDYGYGLDPYAFGLADDYSGYGY